MKDYTKWKTESGEVLNVVDMTNLHLENCIKAIESTKIANQKGEDGIFTEFFMENFSEEYLIVFKTEINRRLTLFEQISNTIDVHTLNNLQTAINSLKFNPNLEDINVQNAEYRLCALRDALGDFIKE